MPRFIDQEGNVQFFEGQAALEALNSGQYRPLDDTPVPVTTPSGRRVSYAPEDVPEAQAFGNIAGRDLQAEVAREEQERAETELQMLYGGFGGQVRAGIEGAASGLTLGLYDVMADALGMSSEEYARANPDARLGGEIVGMVAPAMFSEGASLAVHGAEGAAKATKLGVALAKTPAGFATSQAMKLVPRLGGGVKGLAAAHAAEGAAYSLVQGTSRLLVSDEPLTSEAVVAELGGVLWGAGIGGAAGVGVGLLGKSEKALRAAADREAAAAILDLGSRDGQKLTQTIAGAMNDVDTTVDDLVVNHDRALGRTAVSDAESTAFARRGAMLRQHGDDIEELAVQQLRAADAYSAGGDRLVSLQEQHKALTELGKDVLSDLEAQGMKTTHRSLKIRQRKADEVLTRAATDPTPANMRAMDEALGQLRLRIRNVGGDAMGVDIEGRIAQVDELRRATKGRKVPAGDEGLRGALARYQSASAGFEGISPDVLYNIAGRGNKLKGVTDYIEATRALGTELGVTPSPAMTEVLDGLGDALAGLNKRLADPALAAVNRVGLDEARAALRTELGVPAGERLTPKHIKAVLEGADAAKQVAALKAMDDYYRAARNFAGETGQAAHIEALDNAMAATKDAVKGSLGAADTGGIDKAALYSAVGLVALEELDGDTPVAEIATAVALAKLAKMKKPGPRSTLGRLARAMVGRGVARTSAQMGSRAAGTMGGGMGAALGYHVGTGLVDTIADMRQLGSMGNGVMSRVRDMFASAAKGSRRVVSRAPLVAYNVLQNVSFDDNDTKPMPPVRGESKLQALYRQRSAELARVAGNPLAAQARIHDALEPLRMVHAQVADQVEMLSIRVPAYLYENMPKDPGTMLMFGRSMWKPSDLDILRWGEHMKGAFHPVEVLEEATRRGGNISPQAANAVRELYPEIFKRWQMELIQQAPDLLDKLSLQQRTRLSLMADVPLEPSTDPKFVQFVQARIAEHALSPENEPLVSGSGSTPPEQPTDAQALLS